MNFKRPAREDCRKCRGGCCGPIPMERDHLARVIQKYGLPKSALSKSLPNGEVTVLFTEKGDCPYLSDEGECSIYPDRPKLCKDYGMIKKMPCGYLYPNGRVVVGRKSEIRL